MTDLKKLAAEADTAVKTLDRVPGLVEEYLKSSGYPQTAFARACGCGIDLIRHMRSGRDLRHGTFRKMLAYIARGERAPVEK